MSVSHALHGKRRGGKGLLYTGAEAELPPLLPSPRRPGALLLPRDEVPAANVQVDT